jgi:hypothetical protein
MRVKIQSFAAEGKLSEEVKEVAEVREVGEMGIRDSRIRIPDSGRVAT